MNFMPQLSHSKFTHTSVLLKKSVDMLVTNTSGNYLDCTFGLGGHSHEVLTRLTKDAHLTVIDRDSDAIRIAKELARDDNRITVIQSNFATINEHVAPNSLDGILLDLGVSSPQLDNAERGFSFNKDGTLDMRMNTEDGMSALQWIKNANINEMTNIFKRFGEERYAKKIATAIDAYRKQHPITRTLELAKIVKDAHPAWEKGKHPATRVFQAIRIHINKELESLAQLLEQSISLLKDNGRLVVISFHSLEDRIVKRFMIANAKGDIYPKKVPVQFSSIKPTLEIVGKAVRPCTDEIRTNIRARSAIMRVAQKRPKIENIANEKTNYN